MDDYAGAFDPELTLDRLSRAALARLGREYMLLGHIRDRALMPPIALRFGPPATEQISILEWMGASPHYTRRMQRAMRIDGDGVGAIMKSLQLDIGFPHRYMEVGYELESEQVGYFWLECCRALLDVEPFGEKAVLSMCHAIEDPTFDATAFATNPRARVRPVHRPPRSPADRLPHCRWRIAIDAQEEALPEPPITHEVGRCALVDFEPDPPRVPASEGLDDYGGEFRPSFGLDELSHGALVRVCKEFTLQNQLLSRSTAIALEQQYGEPAAHELLMKQWRALAPLSVRRLCAALRIADGGVPAILKVLQLHPIFPRDYTRWGFELPDAERGRFWLEDCAMLADRGPKGFFDLLDDPACPGLEAMARAVDPRARCRLLERGTPAWELTIDESAEPADDPEESRFVAQTTVATVRLER